MLQVFFSLLPLKEKYTLFVLTTNVYCFFILRGDNADPAQLITLEHLPNVPEKLG